MRTTIALSLLIALGPIAVSADPTARPAAPRVRGTVAAVSADSLTVTTAEGSQKVLLDAATTILAQVPGTLADVVPGAYVGATIDPQPDGTLISKEIVIFPASMKGSNEGYFPMAGQPHSMMANATVATPAASSMMANATVSTAQSTANGKSIHLVYAGGTQNVTVPPGTPIIKDEPGSASLLASGKHVTVIESVSASEPTAARIYVGEGGVVPR